MSEQLVVVGASVATTAFLERMRELGVSAPIVVVDGDPDAPYDRPPLSKHFLVEADADDITVDWSDLGAELVRGWAVDVRADERVLVVDSGTQRHEIGYSQLVIATGATPARLPIEPRDTLTLRSAEDARLLRRHTSDGQRAIIIGAGAIGVELASSLSSRGAEVVLLDRALGPLERLLVGHLGDDVTRWLREAGVDCRWGVDIAAIAKTDAGWRVQLGGGDIVEGDVLVSAVGARPSVGWLQGTDLLTDGMLLADADGRVLGDAGPVSGIFAMGDVVTRRQGDGATTRTESWAAARHHGAHVAEILCEVAPDPDPRPYFWTEVAGRKLQVVGSLTPTMRLQVEFENAARGAVLYRASDDSAASTDSVASHDSAATDSAEAWIGINAQPRIARVLRGEG